MLEYFSNAAADEEGYVDIDVEEVAKHLVEQAKKDKVGDYKAEDVFFVVQAELDYNESLDN